MFKISFNMAVLAAAASLLFAPFSSATTLVYSQNFDSLDIDSPTALSDDDWLVGANVFSPDGSQFLYSYFSFPAPNGGAGFSALVNDRGGPTQGVNQLSVYNNYNNSAHGLGQLVQAFVFQELLLTSDLTDANWNFTFDAALGNIEAGTTALAFISVLDPDNGFTTTDFAFIDSSNMSADWNTFDLSIYVGEEQVGQLLQFGFLSTTTNYQSSGMYYDNINVTLQPVPLPGALLFMMSAVGGLGFFRRR